MSSSEESLSRAEELLARLEAVRGELERLSSGEAELDTSPAKPATPSGEDRPASGRAGASPERALELLGELSELAKAVEEELDRAQKAAEVDADA